MLIISRYAKKLCGSCLLGILFYLIIEPVSAQTFSYGELEAAYLYNFAKYTKCSGNVSIFKINVYGETENIKEFQFFFKGRKISGNNVELKMIHNGDEVMPCEIVYLPSSASASLPALLKATEGKNVLIVTEDDLAKKGAGISFFIEDEKLKFKINKSVLLKSGIEAAEGLLKLGVVI